MAHTRLLPHHRAPSSSISSPSTTRRKTLRRATGRLASDALPEFVSSPLPLSFRPPLVPLQANLRRLPSRIRLSAKDRQFDRLMRESNHVITGSKRKRVASGNENAQTQDRLARGSKRRKTAYELRRGNYHLSSGEGSQSEEDEMEVDVASTLGTLSDNSDEHEEEGTEEEVDGDDSSDDYFLNEASPKRLNKLLKKRLVELYELIGPTEPADSLKKSEIIDAIVNARDEAPHAPPSSPGRTDGASSEYQSSDDGNFAGDETDAPEFRHPPNGRQLVRRVTVHEVLKQTHRPAHAKNRSASMGNILGHGEPSTSLLPKDKTLEEKNARRRSARSSPTTSTMQQPPVTRLRSRQASGSLPDASNPASPSSKAKGKGKSKQVEFSNAVEVHLQTPSKRSLKSQDSEAESILPNDSENDTIQPSPRRLRSKDREQGKLKLKSKEYEDPHATPVAHSKRRSNIRKAELEEEENELSTRRMLRITPMRRAKRNIGSLKESDVDEPDEEGEEEEMGEEGDEQQSQNDEEEVDELVSSASISPPPDSHGRRISTRRRALRPKLKRVKAIPTGEEENEGDDEEEDAEEDEEAAIAVEPRKLRSGKIVGEEVEEEEEEMEVDQDSIVNEDEDEGEELDDSASLCGSEISVDGENEAEQDHEREEVMEEDVDLTVATAKMLVRLRRDDLVRLCESREIDPSGTKPQLAEALLQWRDRQANDLSSPSSTGTVRPLSHRRNRRMRKDSNTTTTTSDVPVLLRPHHAHQDEPRTPLPEKEKENEDLELDLESLGLEDREIPPEKLTKLEKIGSGGFKDVFIGKFKGRKVAIAEFRGQLSAMDIKELKLLGAFHHNNIVRFVGVSIPENTKDTPVMIVSELCSNGDLFDYIRNEKTPSLHKVLKLMLDIARGLEYLHTRKPSIIHRDCKSSNILITAKSVAKIADFGLAKVKQSTRSMVRSLVGTVNWQAPELWTAHPRYDHKVDVFSCAMVFWEVLQWHLPNKKFPWEGMNEHAIYDVVGTKKQRPSTASLKKIWCPEVVELVEHMWAQEPQDRPTMSEVVGSLEDLCARY